MKIRELTASDIETPEFWHLLWLACESDEATLRRVLNQLLARSTVLGTHGSDDDAIGFYRSLGFVDRSAPGDARWPDRRRYHCVLHPEQFV